ncbi:hypothetical protein GCM10028816_29470 [Spirosoma lituiforme]
MGLPLFPINPIAVPDNDDEINEENNVIGRSEVIHAVDILKRGCLVIKARHPLFIMYHEFLPALIQATIIY